MNAFIGASKHFMQVWKKKKKKRNPLRHAEIPISVSIACKPVLIVFLPLQPTPGWFDKVIFFFFFLVERTQIHSSYVFLLCLETINT